MSSYLLQNDLVIYEMNVRAYTVDESSEVDADIRGSYLGIIEKVMIWDRERKTYLTCFL